MVTYEEHNGIIFVYSTFLDSAKYHIGNIVRHGKGYYLFHEVFQSGLSVQEIEAVAIKLRELTSKLENS